MKKKIISARISNELYQKIKQVSDSQNVTVAMFLKDAINQKCVDIILDKAKINNVKNSKFSEIISETLNLNTNELNLLKQIIEIMLNNK